MISAGDIISSLTPESPQSVPPPPSLHWLILLLVDFATIGIFVLVWCFVQAKWARKITGSNAVYWYASAFILAIPISAIRVSHLVGPVGPTLGLVYGLLYIAVNLLYQVGNFSIKKAVETCYDSTAESGKRLNGLMTIIFSQIYLQYHLHRLSKKLAR